jgi:phage tail P2-like protein
MTYDPSIQPDNRSGLQHALESLLDQCMAKIEHDAPYRTLLFPLETPEQYLPALAIEKGVLDWAPDDEIGGVRQTVADGLIIQSHACTRQGIVDSLAALGINAQVVHSGPYEISVTAVLANTELDEATMLRVMARINAYKAERDKTDVKLLRQASVTAWVGVASTVGTSIHIAARNAASPPADAVWYGVTSTHGVTRLHISAKEQ